MAKGWSGVFLIPAVLGAVYFQKNILDGHDIVGGGMTGAHLPDFLQGWDLRLEGNTYSITVRVLRRRIPFWLNGAEAVGSGAKGDSCLIEYRHHSQRLPKGWL